MRVSACDRGALMLSGALITLCASMIDSRSVGTAAGMAGTAVWIGGMLFTLLIVQSADAWGYDPLFAALAALDLLAAGVVWSLLRATSRQVRNSQEGNQAC
jgi:ACS family hexuronate transporter-like MFS transporter